LGHSRIKANPAKISIASAGNAAPLAMMWNTNLNIIIPTATAAIGSKPLVILTQMALPVSSAPRADDADLQSSQAALTVTQCSGHAAFPLDDTSGPAPYCGASFC